MAVQKAVSLARTKHRAAEIADGKGRWTGRPQEDPGGSFPEGETSEHEVPETPASDQQPQEEEKIRVAPGQSLKPSTTDVFERLHAYHAASLEKKALLQKLAAQQVEAQAESLKRCTVRTCCSEEEALQIYGRLYQEAAHRRRRQVEREQEETLSSQCSTSSLRSQVEGPPRWEQLYHSAPLKEKRLGDERKRAAEAEERWLAQHCIHRSSDKTEASEIFDRLYGESESRERRREQRKAAEVASQVRELAESSVHTRTLSVADLELRTRRLYEDGLQRLQRLELGAAESQSAFLAFLQDAGTSFREMKVLFFAALAAPIVDSAVLLRSQHRAWDASSAKAEPADCNAPCAWDCGTPECSQSCKAVCQPPRCFTACKKPQEQDCRHVCKDPKCTVVCPPQTCQSENCPPPACSTVCGEAECHMECPGSGCETRCEDPVCHFDCKIDMKTCVKPDCKLTCPKGGCHNKTIDLPFAYRLETNAQTSAAAAASPAAKSISAAAEEGEVAWKGLAKAGPQKTSSEIERTDAGEKSLACRFVHKTGILATVSYERRLQESQPTEAPRRSASAGPSRFEMLYSDATRRDEDRKFWQKCHEKEELEMSQHQLAVKAPQCKRQVWAQRTPTPQKAPNSARNHQRGAATADVDELQMAQEAPLPAHSALVLPGQCLPERDLLPGGGSGRHQPKIPTVALNRANRNEGPAQGTPSGTAVRRAQSPVPVPGATSPLAAGSKLQSEPSAAASPSRSQTPRQRPQTRAGNSNGGKERASSAPRSSAAGTPVAEPTSGRPGVAAKDGLRAPRAEDLAAAGAKRGQSPMPHTPRAAASPVDGAKARCARTSDRLSPTRAPEEADTRSSSRAARATAICTPKVGPKKDATPPPRSKTPPPNAQAGLRPSGTMPSERGASTPPTKESPPERDKTPKDGMRALKTRRSFGCILAMPAMVAGKWFLTVVALAHASSLPMDEKAERECSPDDLGCMAREEACSIAKQMASDWPLQYANLRQTYRELTDVCAGRPLDFTDTPEEPLDVPGTNPEVLFCLDCSDRAACITNVVKYQSDNPGAKWGMKAGSMAAKFAVDVVKEVLKAGGQIALKGSLAFTFIGAAVGAFFPSAGGLPVNPCTFAEAKDWGRCVWEQVKPFVQEFVEDQLDDAFGNIWDATINGYKTRLWALNDTVYHNSKLYPNGTIEEMSNATRDRMYEDLEAVHYAMLGSIQLFLTDRAIKTTAGAYLSQFASLHFSVMTNLLGSLKYRTAGDRHVFQTVVTCYARRVYERATAAFKSRMSAAEAHEEDQGWRDCCVLGTCNKCHFISGEFKDTWKLSCDWKSRGYDTRCLSGACVRPDPSALYMTRHCYQCHREEVANQTVTRWHFGNLLSLFILVVVEVSLNGYWFPRATTQVQFWQNWLSPLPIWLDSIALMQSIRVKPTATPRSSGFDCSAF
ncbi:ANP2 [Symbiodinium sp. KB8]|nr:ANP2 [Symbiodinium sp. KB8]